jgi:hypothetical protein
MMAYRTLIGVAAFLVVIHLPLAGSAQQSGEHHPTLQAAAPQTIPAQIPGRAMSGMAMGRGMMGGGMMESPGMMGFGGMMIDHVEGRISFLKTELKITDAQSAAWNAFAESLRASAKRMNEVRQTMMKPNAAHMGVVEMLDARERMLSAALENTRTMKASFTALHAKFSDEQKKAADELFAFPMGRGMMAFSRNARTP